MNVCTKCHGNPSNSHCGILLKTTNGLNSQSEKCRIHPLWTINLMAMHPIVFEIFQSGPKCPAFVFLSQNSEVPDASSLIKTDSFKKIKYYGF